MDRRPWSGVAPKREVPGYPPGPDWRLQPRTRCHSRCLTENSRPAVHPPGEGPARSSSPASSCQAPPPASRAGHGVLASATSTWRASVKASLAAAAFQRWLPPGVVLLPRRIRRTPTASLSGDSDHTNAEIKLTWDAAPDQTAPNSKQPPQHGDKK